MLPALSKDFLDINANHRVWIHSETLTWHDNNIQSESFVSLNFSIFHKNLNYPNYLVNFELFYSDILNLQVLATEDRGFTKTETKDIALFTFCTYNNNVPQNLSKGDLILYHKTNKLSFKNLAKVFL